MEQTKVTTKHQATIPRRVREMLGIESGGHIAWHILRSVVVVDTHKKVMHPVDVLTSQITKPLTIDAVQLVHRMRQEMV